jgi:hypothetical protein
MLVGFTIGAGFAMMRFRFHDRHEFCIGHNYTGTFFDVIAFCFFNDKDFIVPLPAASAKQKKNEYRGNMEQYLFHC